MEKKPEEMTIGEFMEWYFSEYENSYVLPSDYTRTIDRLTGYNLAKKDSDENYILESSVNLLRGAENFFRVVKQYTNWKIK